MTFDSRLRQMMKDDVAEPFPVGSSQWIVSKAKRQHRYRRGAVVGCVALIGALAGGGIFRTIDRSDHVGGVATTAATDATFQQGDELSVQVEGGAWFSEIVPSVAHQLPNVSAEELLAAFESDQIQPGFSPAAATTGKMKWEGQLMAGSYEVSSGANARQVVAAFSAEFENATNELNYDQRLQPNGLTPYEVVIVASIVEAEARTDADRSKIARVIYNRLAEQDWLGVDATSVYEIGVRGRPLTVKDLEESSEFNTRAPSGVHGLPPTPIGAPSRKSLEAAISPAEGDWYWYVIADEAGNYAFHSTVDEFEKQLQLSREAGLL